MPKAQNVFGAWIFNSLQDHHWWVVGGGYFQMGVRKEIVHIAGLQRVGTLFLVGECGTVIPLLTGLFLPPAVPPVPAAAGFIPNIHQSHEFSRVLTTTEVGTATRGQITLWRQIGWPS